MIRLIPMFHAARAADPMFSAYLGATRIMAILLRRSLCLGCMGSAVETVFDKFEKIGQKEKDVK